MNERIERLRTESLHAVPHLSIERAKLVTEAYRQYAGTVETPVLRALVFQHVMEHKRLWLGDGELIVGEKGEEPQWAPSFPELCCHTMEDLAVMDQREKIFFRVPEDVRKIQEEQVIPYWQDRSMRKKILDHMTPEWTACL